MGALINTSSPDKPAASIHTRVPTRLTGTPSNEARSADSADARTAMPTRVTVRTTNGNEYVKQVDYPLGHPRHPLSDREIEEKFRGLTAGLFTRARAGRVIDMVWRLEELKDVGVLMPLLKVARPRK